ncbi:9562_t:CDS:2, partial [Entrophospora sp. SA101]
MNNKFAEFIKKFEETINQEPSHDCTNSHEDEGKDYPHWPCGNLIFKYTTKPKDWLQNGWAFECSESRRNSVYNAQINLKRCLGMIECSKCKAQVRPKIKNHGGKVKEQVKKGCPIPTCSGSLEWIKCSASCKFISLDNPDKSGFRYFLLHYMHHQHGRCLQTKPFNIEKEKFKERILSTPDTLPKKLQVGQSFKNNSPLGSVKNISDAYSNNDRVAYYRRSIIDQEKIITKISRKNSDNFVIDFLRFQEEHPNFVQKADFQNKGIICLQSDWMQNQAFSENNFSGILTDSTYKYFANAFLLSRWIPILISVILKEDGVHYKEHFKYLFSWVDKVKKSPNNNLYAERNGFVEAYIEHGLQKICDKNLPIDIINSHEITLEKEAKSLLKGCQEHFQQSITRIARNHVIISHDSSANFVSTVMKLLDICEKEKFDDNVKLIKKNWPDSNTWLEWWIYTDAGKILFPALSSMNPDLAASLPNSTNAQESMHRQYYMCGTTQQSIITEVDFQNRTKGHSLKYGDVEPWKKVAELYGSTKPSRKKIKQGAEILYTCYLNNVTWWPSNIGTMQNNGSGLKKLHISFTLRDALGTKNVKTSLNNGREMIRQHIIEKQWEEDNQFGSITNWFEKIIAEEKESINLNEIIFRVHPDEPCPYVRSNLGQCINRKINYEEYIISYPPILIFELTQRDGNSYHSSNQLDFPLHLYCKSSEETLEYMLTARAFSTLP